MADIELTTVPVETSLADGDELYFNDVSESPDALNRITWVNAIGSVLNSLRTNWTPASSSGAASLTLHEDTDNGSNKVTVQGPASVASNRIQTLQDVTGTIYVSSGDDVSLADGGTGASLTDPNDDRVMFWDDSAGQVTWLTMGTNLSITGTTLNASGGLSGLGSTDNAVLRTDGTGGATAQGSGVIIDDFDNITAAGTPTFATAGGGLNIGGAGANFAISSGGGAVRMIASCSVAWSSTGNAQASLDTGLARVGAGIVGINDASTGGAALSFVERTAPSAPSANGCYLYVEDNGSGKTRLMALFSSGAAQQVAIQP